MKYGSSQGVVIENVYFWDQNIFINSVGIIENCTSFENLLKCIVLMNTWLTCPQIVIFLGFLIGQGAKRC